MLGRKFCSAQYIGKNMRTGKKRSIKKLERESAVIPHALAEDCFVDYDNTRILQRRFHTHKHRAPSHWGPENYRPSYMSQPKR